MKKYNGGSNAYPSFQQGYTYYRPNYIFEDDDDNDKEEEEEDNYNNDKFHVPDYSALDVSWNSHKGGGKFNDYNLTRDNDMHHLENCDCVLVETDAYSAHEGNSHSGKKSKQKLAWRY